jgi:hypothetical protein
MSNINPQGIAAFLSSIAKSGGVAYSNTYEVTFNFNDGSGTKGNADLKSALRTAGFGNLSSNARDTAYANLTLMCEEASLPGMMAMTGNTTGVYMGEGQVNYAHTQAYQDITLGWICDANLSPLKFLNAWMKFIFPDTAGESNPKQAANRLSYPDQYKCESIKIVKGERNSIKTIGRIGGIYTLYDAWPYSIQSTPIAYGSSQLLKISAAFYYRRWEFAGAGAINANT